MVKQRDTFVFCTACRAALEDRGGYKVCTQCGKHYYANPKPAAVIVLSDASGKLLITKRGRDPFKDWWDFPGGFVEEDETLEQAATRELKEETGVEAANLSYIGSFKEDYEFRGEVVPVVVAVFAGSLPQDVPVVVGDDVSSYKFIAKQDLNIEEIAFTNQRAFMENYFK
ncbi:MAG TPA: NUDIX domain-containing protein [Bacillota bacterium]|nr:NUDIX domain-containing protein [Bacillota bacterium]